MELVKKIENELWNKFQSYQYVKHYMIKWQKTTCSNDWNEPDECNFNIHYKINTLEINLTETLHNIKDNELLFKIAIDLGIEIPNVIYGVPLIEKILYDRYEDAHIVFKDSLKKVYEEPDVAILMANSALEAIIKKICQDERIKSCSKNHTTYNLIQHLLKEFEYFPNSKLDDRIRNIGSSLLTICQAIEGIRSENTTVHGHLKENYIVDDPLYAQFIVNTIATIGLFLINYYEKKYFQQRKEEEKEGPFNDIPF